MHCIHAILFPPDEEVTDRKTVKLPHGWKMGFVIEDDHLKNAIIISTDYFGGCGEQNAVVIKDSFVVKRSLWKVSDSNSSAISDYNSINDALAFFGLKKDDGMDEFDTINLGSYRSNEDIENEMDEIDSEDSDIVYGR